jgi:hypothetical protein
MRLLHRSILTSLVLGSMAAPALLAPAVASAQTVIVLGIRSVEGDDEFARNLTGALRHSASQVQGWTVSEREVTLTQMALAHGCDEPDPTCLEQMAQTLTAQRILYGDVRRTNAGQTYDFSVNLHLFNAETNQIENTVTDTIPGVRRDIDDLREPARRYVAALSGAPRAGTLRVTVNVPGAEVFVDGESVGAADGEGHLVVSDVQAGSRSVRVVAPGHQSFASTVSVEAYGEATFEAELQAGSSGPSAPFPTELVVGVCLLVVGAALAGGMFASWVQINDMETYSDYQALRARAGTYLAANPDAPSDVCALIAPSSTHRGALVSSADVQTQNRLDAVCRDAPTWEALQFVFGIGAAAAAGVGAYFLVSALSGSSAPPSEQAIQLTPSFGPDHVYLGVAGRF